MPHSKEKTVTEKPTRKIKLHEVVLLVMNRATQGGDDHMAGISAEMLTLALLNEPLAANLALTGLNSIYASMSGMQTQPRHWIEPAATVATKDGGTRPKIGRSAPFRITDAGRSRVRTLTAELASKELVA